MPAGVDDGQTLRLAGKGESAPGGTTGHLYVVLNVQGDERFKREAEDILTEIPVSFVKAALGGEVEIYTLEDNCNGTATVELKPGTQPDDVIVRRGQGIPRVEAGRTRRSGGAVAGGDSEEAVGAAAGATARARDGAWGGCEGEAGAVRGGRSRVSCGSGFGAPSPVLRDPDLRDSR